MSGNSFNQINMIFLFILLGLSVYTDLKYGKIYNKITLPGIFIGIVLNTVNMGLLGLFNSLAGVIFIMLLFLVFAKLGGIGGGDVKLMMAVGAFTGFGFVLRALLFAAVFGGILALLVTIKHKIFTSTIRNLKTDIHIGAITREIPVWDMNKSNIVKFRYSPAIALGTLLTVYLYSNHWLS